MADLTPAQRRLADDLIRIGRARGASPKEIKAALETAAVEKNFTNTGGGDSDSSNWRQERASVYGPQWEKTGGALNFEASANRFYDEAAQFNKTGQYGSAGQLAAAVQRPAAQYRGRYQEHSGLANALLGGAGGSSAPAAAPTGSPIAAASSGPQTVDGGQAGDFTSLLSSLIAKPQQQAAPMAIAPPVFAAGPKMPQGFAPMTSTPQAPQQQNGVSAALSLVGALGGTAPTIGSSAASPTADGSQQPRSIAATVDAVRNGTGAEAALGWAKSKIGFKETGTNAGGVASYANKRFGMSNQPWCAMFTSLAVTKGGAPSSARTASVAEVRRKAAAKQGYTGFVDPGAAREGDLILFGDDHIGMVDHVADGKIFYVGGNQSNGVTMASTDVGHGDIVRPKYGAKKR